jgi:hypothetical protein
MNPVVRLMERKPKQMFKDSLKELSHARIKTFVIPSFFNSASLPLAQPFTDHTEHAFYSAKRRSIKRTWYYNPPSRTPAALAPRPAPSIAAPTPASPHCTRIMRCYTKFV